MRNNNFDILRLLCAVMVLASHSYALLGLKDSEPLYLLTGSMLLSDIGLCGFFTISGYLIFQSLQNSSSLLSYLMKRCLRIFPGLVCCLVLTVLMCRLFYTGDGMYFAQNETYSFVWRNLLLYPMQWTIPGVFEENPMNTVNGSLWTLCYEFSLYIMIIGLFFVRNRKFLIGLVSTALILALAKNIFFGEKFAHTVVCYMGVNNFCHFAQYFISGMFLSLLNPVEWKDWNKWLGIVICSSCFVGFVWIGHSISAMLFLSVVFIFAGVLYFRPVVDCVKRVGDMSYGMYIYGMPVQQALVANAPRVAPPALFAVSLVVTLVLAFISWHGVEKRALVLKKNL